MDKIKLSGSMAAKDCNHVIFTESDEAYSLNCISFLRKDDVAAVSIDDWEQLDNYDFSLLHGKHVYLWPDKTDDYKRMSRMSGVLKKHKAKLSWINPEDLDIPDGTGLEAFVAKYNPDDDVVIEQIHGVLANSYPEGPAGTVKRRFEDAIRGRRETIKLPWHKIDKATMALTPGSVTLLCGDGGAAKSLMLLQLCQYWTFNLGHEVVIYELEEDREYHLIRALAQKTKEAWLINDRRVKENEHRARELYDENIDFLNKMGGMIYEAPIESVDLTSLAVWVEEQAKAGKRIICIDPITAATATKDIWIADSHFITAVKKSIVNYGSSLVLVTHPKKGAGGAAGMDNLSGGACWSRFCQTIMWLKNLGEEKEIDVLIDGLKTSVKADRTMTVLKARNSFGGGRSFAMSLGSLALREEGEILKNKKGR